MFLKVQCQQLHNTMHVMYVYMLFKCFNHLGLCQGAITTRKNVDTVILETNAKLKEWKHLVEAEFHPVL